MRKLGLFREEARGIVFLGCRFDFDRMCGLPFGAAAGDEDDGVGLREEGLVGFCEANGGDVGDVPDAAVVFGEGFAEAFERVGGGLRRRRGVRGWHAGDLLRWLSGIVLSMGVEAGWYHYGGEEHQDC